MKSGTAHQATERLLPLAAALACALATCLGLAAHPAHADAIADTAVGNPVGGRLIVGFQVGVDSAAQEQSVAAAGGIFDRDLGVTATARVRPTEGTSVLDLAARLKADPKVRYADRDAVVSITREPNDPLYPTQYAYGTPNGRNVAAPSAWDGRTNCYRVAVLDTGVQTNHPDLKNNIWHNSADRYGNGRDDDRNGYIDDYYGVDVRTNRGPPTDQNGHGTHVAGIVAAQGSNSIGVAGTCWRGAVMAVKFLNAHGEGSVSGAIEAFNYAIDNGAKVINCSFGTDQSTDALRDVIKRARKAGVLVAVAAGNESKSIDAVPVYPASYTYGNIITVAATTQGGSLASFSNYGSKSVDIAAPGTQINSTYFGSRYAYLSGTSMATPMVSGAAGMLRAQNNKATYTQLRNALRKSVDRSTSLTNKVVSGGRLNTARSLGIIAGDGSKPSPFATTSPAPSFTTQVEGPTTFSWTQSTDNSNIVAYYVYVDGRLVGQTHDPDGRGPGVAGRSVSAQILPGAHTWYVVASDPYLNSTRSS